MKKRKAWLWVVLILIASLVFPVVSVTAKSTTTSFVAQESVAPVGPPERQWISEDGVLHVRNRPAEGTIWGDLNGTVTVISNINLDLATGNGTGHSTIIREGEWNGMTGSFEGRSQFTFVGFQFNEGQTTAHGTGDFEGLLMKVTFTSNPNDPSIFDVVGTILDPLGE